MCSVLCLLSLQTWFSGMSWEDKALRFVYMWENSTVAADKVALWNWKGHLWNSVITENQRVHWSFCYDQSSVITKSALVIPLHGIA